MWESIFAIALKLLGFTLDRINQNEDMKKAYLAFVEAYASHLGSSVAAHDAFEKEKEEFENPPK